MMWLRSRLRKGQVNLWTLRNRHKSVLYVVILFVFILVGEQQHANNQVSDRRVSPSDTSLSSTNGTRRVDNISNVENYAYTSNKRLHPEIKYLKDCKYEFCDEINIPGMPDTKENDYLNKYIFSTSQCPQGLAFAKNFVLITSYSEGNECLGELMVFDRTTGEYLVTLGMDPKSHLGGITYDGKNVWVCNSSRKAIERISFDFIELMALENRGEVVDATEVVDIYKVDHVPSCITFHSGRIWIATHTLFFDSKVGAYYYNAKDDKLLPLSEYNIPAKVQGIAFDEKDRIYLSTSYGRTVSSFLKIYDSLATMSSKPSQPNLQIEMPPGSEELDADDNTLYVLFESAGERYLEGTDGKGVSTSPIDKILKIHLKSVK